MPETRGGRLAGVRRGSILTVGPRVLSEDGWARVWIDTGSGPGYIRMVPAEQLTLAEVDDGEGPYAFYRLHRPVER